MQIVSRSFLVAALAAFSFAAVVGASVHAEDDVTDPAAADGVRDLWIHDDIEAGYAAAKESGKPLLVAFR